MSFVHDLVYGAAAVLGAPWWMYRLARSGKWRTDWPGRLGRTELRPVDRPTLLIHAVSVGEVNAIRQLVHRFTAAYRDDRRLVIATTTDTGFDRARRLFGTRHEVVRYPFDFTFAVNRFLDAVAPDVVALVELELWPNFIAACRRRAIPVVVINGRLSRRSYRGYRRFKSLIRPMFASLHAACVQDEEYARRFADLGTPAQRIHVMGTMKWDSARITDHVEGAKELAEAMGIDPALPLVVCGSTGPGEERLFVEKLAGLTDHRGRPVQLLITPRKPERFEEAAAAMGQPVRRTRCPDGTRRPPDGGRLFLLDTMGELAKAYALADVVVIGRSFNDQYGSDMTEAIALGKPTIIGPRTGDFAEMLKHLRAGQGIVQLDGADQLARTVVELLDTPRGRQLAANGRAVIRQQQGATERHFQLLDRLLAESLTTRPADSAGTPHRGN